ncbi:unnamed protein product [Urochloa decumbens]|uniref:Uncharacterized protein n=1 Tax=Urochloa decumbens TaxID=240449 RepID=A0ABC9BMA1_9POAL
MPRRFYISMHRCIDRKPNHPFSKQQLRVEQQQERASAMAAQVLQQVYHSLHDLLWHDTSSPQASAMATSVLLVAFPLLALLLVRRRLSSSSAATAAREQQLAKLPSPPGRLPVIGHLHLMGSLPHVTLCDLAAKHGRDGLLLLRLGSVPTLFVSSARAAQAVLRTNDHAFSSRCDSAVAGIIFYGPSDAAFCPYGEHWRQVKKIATTHLLTNKKVRSYRHAREREVRLVLDKVREAAKTRTVIDLTEMLNEFSNDIISHAVSGSYPRDENTNALFRELTEANSTLLGGFNLDDYFPVLAKLGIVRRMLCAGAHKVNQRWDELLDRLIDAHERRPASERGEESDFIDVLLSLKEEYNLTRDHIKAQLVMFQAGTDTSFVALDNVIVELVRNPAVMAKLQAEVRTAVPKGKEMVTEDDLESFTYLRAIIKETLRLRIPAPLLVPHLSMADADVEGYTIPSGTRVLINVGALSKDPSYWEKPEEFIPERFMEGGSAAAMDFRGNDFPFLPFGSGRRMCPGINFAMPMIELTVANLVYHFNWELPPGEKGVDMTEAFGLTVHRVKNLHVVPVVPH